MDLLLRSEEMILLAIWHLQDEAYGVPIRRYLSEATGREISLASVYVPLDRLTHRGLVQAIDAPPTKERGGRRKRHFKLTSSGISALSEVRSVHDKLWMGISKLSLR